LTGPHHLQRADLGDALVSTLIFVNPPPARHGVPECARPMLIEQGRDDLSDCVQRCAIESLHPVGQC
jgi:hypothetical protein